MPLHVVSTSKCIQGNLTKKQLPTFKLCITWPFEQNMLASHNASVHHTNAFSVIVDFPHQICSSLFTPPLYVPFHVLSFIYIEESFSLSLLLWIFLNRCPWVKRHIMFTDHVFNDRRDLKSASAPLPLSQMMQRFYIINQPAFLVLIISQSWNIHNLLTITKKTHLGVVCSMCVQLQWLYWV